MSRIQHLTELGGSSMIAILVVSVILGATVIAKLVQFTASRYWTIKSPSKADVASAMNGLKIIEIASVVAPLLGLLGTVMGMISAFQVLESAGGSPEIGLLAAGIWRALATTAAGMVVAIIATVFLGLFDGTVERMVAKLEVAS